VYWRLGTEAETHNVCGIRTQFHPVTGIRNCLSVVRLRARRPGFVSRQRQIFLFVIASRPALRPIPFQPTGTRGSFPGGKSAGT
jgi:hypothetical protein